MKIFCFVLFFLSFSRYILPSSGEILENTCRHPNFCNNFEIFSNIQGKAPQEAYEILYKFFKEKLPDADQVQIERRMLGFLQILYPQYSVQTRVECFQEGGIIVGTIEVIVGGIIFIIPIPGAQAIGGTIIGHGIINIIEDATPQILSVKNQQKNFTNNNLELAKNLFE